MSDPQRLAETVAEWLSMLMAELYHLIGPEPFMIARAVFFGIGMLSLIFVFIPRSYGRGEYRSVRYFHLHRFIAACVFFLLAFFFVWVESSFGSSYRWR